MIDLPFITTQAKLDDPEIKDLTKQAIYELNNQLTIPMKILDIEYKPDIHNKDWNAVNVKVEDCADKTEWSNAVSNFLAGVEWKRKIFGISIRKK